MSEAWKFTYPEFRRFNEYLNSLKIKEEDLTGKIILDIGSGATHFAREAKLRKINCKIYSLDPIFFDRERINQLEMMKFFERNHFVGLRGELVAGLAESIPFKEETFNLVLSLFSCPWYYSSKEKMFNFLNEVVRVLKTNGRAVFYPSHPQNCSGSSIPAEHFSQIVEKLRREGIILCPKLKFFQTLDFIKLKKIQN